VIDQIASAWDYNQGVDTNRLSIDAEPVIPRLYSAGEAAAHLGWRRYHNTLGAYMIFGRIAGQNAAAEARMS
jgi:succinate dehydrogenase/fumarate reductase flavoprotein subunit